MAKTHRGVLEQDCNGVYCLVFPLCNAFNHKITVVFSHEGVTCGNCLRLLKHYPKDAGFNLRRTWWHERKKEKHEHPRA